MCVCGGGGGRLELLGFNKTNGSSPILDISSEATHCWEQWEVSPLFYQNFSMSANVQSTLIQHLKCSEAFYAKGEQVLGKV